MANTPTTPKPARQTITITLPPGVTAEQYQKSYASWEEQKVKSAKAMKADWRAMTRTCKSHPDEYLKFRIEEWRKEGLDPSKLKSKK